MESNSVPVKSKIPEILLEAGIDHVFGIPGGNTITLFDGLYDYREQIKIITPMHEQVAASMAEMYGRITGKPGVFVAQGGFAATLGLFGVLKS